MRFQDLPIKRKVVSVIMLTSVSALVLTAAAFMIYDAVSYRATIEQHLRTSAAILGETTTAFLDFRNESDAQHALNVLKADSEIVAAALYDDTGHSLAHYPEQADVSSFPAHPGQPGISRQGNYLILFQPAIQRGGQVGTVYLKSDLQVAFARLRLHALITFGVIVGSVLVAFIISNYLQQRIT